MKCKVLNKRNPRGAGSKPKFAKKYKTKYIKVLLPVDAERDMKEVLATLFEPYLYVNSKK